MTIYILKNPHFNTFEIRDCEEDIPDEEENIVHLERAFTHVIKLTVENNHVTKAEELVNGQFIGIFRDGCD